MASNRKSFTIAMDAKKLARLDQIARERDRSRSWLVRKLCEVAIEAADEMRSRQGVAQ